MTTPAKRAAALRRKQQRLAAQRTEIRREMRRNRDELRTVFDGQEASPVIVSDHALVRYIERVKGVDLDAVRAEMVTADLERQVETLGGTGRFPGPNGCRLVLCDGTVVTVVTRESKREE